MSPFGDVYVRYLCLDMCVAWKMAALILVVVDVRCAGCDVLATTKSSRSTALRSAAVREPWKLHPSAVWDV